MNKIQQIQEILGVTADGIFGPKSRAALDALIKGGALGEPSKRFRDFMPFILDWEGRYYENDPDDPGGATKYGIDQRSHPDVDIRNLTEAGAMQIYWQEWVKAGCEDMASPLAEVFFNCAVNMGLGRAREFLSKSGGNANAFLDLQEAKYRSLAAAGMDKFLKGWLNRTKALRSRIT